jgi:imidazole glycerol-phosphate synthase subunit HisH
MIAIVDYGAGNVFSVAHVCEHLGQEVTITHDPDSILTASHVIVPGQGAFKQAMTALTDLKLGDVLHTLIKRGTPFLGICLGFQILFEASTEHGDVQGLGVFPGTCTKIEAPNLTVPHMGWNQCQHSNHAMFKGIKPEDYVYFVHSYCIKAANTEHEIAHTTYGERFVSAVAKNNVWGTQFHPEKSSAVGQQLLRNFFELTAS